MLKPALIGAALGGLAVPALADTEMEETRMDPLVIEGSRLDQRLTEYGSSVSVITSEDIDRLGFDFALDAVAAAPGVTVNSNGPFGGVASVRIRGAGTAQTLVLIDGVPVNDPSTPGGGFDFARLDTADIARIEVLKGPQSTLWGTDAIGGVVSIRTKAPEPGLGGSAFGEIGSFETFRGGASLESGGEAGDFRVAATGITTEGISRADEDNGNTEKDGYGALTLSARGGLDLGDAARLTADILWSEAETEFDSFDFTAEGSVADGDEVSKTDEISSNVSLEAPLLAGRLANLLLIGYSDIERENLSDGATSFQTGGQRVLYRYQGTLAVDDRNTLAFGAEREETRAAGDDTSIDGLFALYEFKPTGQITLTGGVRVDDHERFGSETTARLAAAFNPTETLTLRASWGEGFKAPTLFQTTFFCCGASAPNADLQPETSEAFDIGLDWRAADGRAEASVTWFDQDTENQIDFSFLAGGYENISQVSSQGVELHGALVLADWLTVSADYAWIDAEQGDGGPVALVPEHSGDVTFAFDPGGAFSGAVLLRLNGEEVSSDGSELDGWARVDLTGTYALSDTIELFGRIENLFDESYQQVLGYGTPGLSGSLGLRLSY